MIIILKIICLTSVWVLGLTIITQKNMALYSLRMWAEDKSSKVYEPLILCHWCMPSIHSVVGFAFAFGIGIIHQFSIHLVIIYPLVVMGSSIVCGLVWTLYTTLDAIQKYYINAEKISFFDIKDRIKKHKKESNGN